jgi:Concanavalin A-like lectin/glucanases superfamily
MARGRPQPARGRGSLLLLLAASTLGCGSQFSDPILDKPEPAPCPTEHALQLEGASYGNATRLIQDNFTIEAFIQTASSPVGQAFNDGSALVFADVETVQVNDFASGIVNDKLVMSVGGPDTPASSTSQVTTGKWVHVAATRNHENGIVLVFVDGVLEGSAVGNLNALADAPNINVGGRANRNFYSGLMSELRLWSTVRTQSEIVAHMHERLNGDEPGLVGYYRFDERTGTTARDSSPSGNDLVFTGPVSWAESDLPFCEP